ncbi:hypothetical protein AVEN_136294-1, partial [Araneus ventricosus]
QKMWENVRRACGIYPEKRISCLRKNGQEVRNISEMVDVLAEAFASICSASNYTEPFLTHKNRMERIKLRFQTTKHLSYNSDLTIFELHTALSVIKHTSPGPDEEEGVPQGRVLSVTLFVLAINPILSVIPQTVQKNLYVDDLHISCYARNMQLIERQLQTAINNIVEWSNKSGLTISAQKTIGIHFCKRPLHPVPELFLSGVPIRFQDNYKFLGIVFDKRLTFLPHIASLRKRCLRSLNILRTLSNTSWGADRSCLLRVYRSIIRSMIDYGSVVYGSARPSYLKRLDYVHHQALRLSLGAFRTSPIPSLYAEAFEPSLSSRRDKLSLSYYFRILSNDKHPLRGTLLNGNNNRLFNARPSCIPHFGLRMRNILPDTFHSVKVHTTDFCGHPPWMENSISYINPFGNFTKSDSNNSVLISLFNQHRQSYQSYQPDFTDGSKSLNHVGCAFFTNGHIISYKLHSFTSVFSSEITAVYFALKYIDEHEIRKSILYTDSMSLLESLRSSSTRNPLIKEVKDFYRHLLSKGARILFSWVPSHVGITGNELADKSAKSATEFLIRPIVYADVRSAVNQWGHCQWQEKWNMETNTSSMSLNRFSRIGLRNLTDAVTSC